MNYSEDSAVWHLHCSGRNMRKQNISSAVSRHAAACRQSQFKLYVCCSPAPARALPTTTHTVGLGQAHRAWLWQARPAQAAEKHPTHRPHSTVRPPPPKTIGLKPEQPETKALRPRSPEGNACCLTENPFRNAGARLNTSVTENLLVGSISGFPAPHGRGLLLKWSPFTTVQSNVTTSLGTANISPQTATQEGAEACWSKAGSITRPGTHTHLSDPPMDTSLMFSLSRNSRATDTFSSCIWRKVGLWLYFRNIFFWDRTSRSPMSRSPSLRSVCRLPILLLTHFRCSLHQRVKVFCCIFFHGASSARSFSVAGISASLSAERAFGAGAALWWSRGWEPLIFMVSAVSWFAGFSFFPSPWVESSQSSLSHFLARLFVEKRKREQRTVTNSLETQVSQRK